MQMKEKNKDPKKVVFPHLAAFVKELINQQKKQEKLTKQTSKVSTRAMQQFHMYSQQRKKKFRLHDQRHADGLPGPVPQVACRQCRGG